MEITEQKERAGLSLLKKSKKGLFHLIFSRLGLMILLLLIQFAVLSVFFLWFGDFLPHLYGGTVIFTAAMVLVLLNSRTDPTAKITWLVIIMAMPVFGSLLYLYTKRDIGHRALRKRISDITRETGSCLEQDKTVFAALQREDPGAAGLARYINRNGCCPVHENTALTYFPSGEKKFEELLRQLENARDFIFMEYFIIDEGIMWGQILEILAEKAAEGVDVRVMYDGTCEFSSLPHDYPKRLKALGIKCKVFAPATPFMSTHYNYRDHRKILVIDGHTAFCGGINLADEYINRKARFGHWKDTAVMLKGDAVKSFTLMFLQMWGIDEKASEIKKFLDRSSPAAKTEGFVIPYSDCPLDDDKVGERVYVDMLNRAEKYVHIMTPYLILDGVMETALKFAAERGVDVKLILPGIPDKKMPYALAKTHYSSLLDSGVEIYEYTPGFVHAKNFISDGREGVVGTINLDYRSLYHHFECAVYFYGSPCVDDAERDFEETLAKCRKITRESIKNEKPAVKAAGALMKVIAPLL